MIPLSYRIPRFGTAPVTRSSEHILNKLKPNHFSFTTHYQLIHTATYERPDTEMYHLFTVFTSDDVIRFISKCFAFFSCPVRSGSLADVFSLLQDKSRKSQNSFPLCHSGTPLSRCFDLAFRGSISIRKTLIRNYQLSRNVTFVPVLLLHKVWKQLEGFHKLILSSLEYVIIIIIIITIITNNMSGRRGFDSRQCRKPTNASTNIRSDS